jgi:nucleoside-diphosphate-sugar epimerase
MIFAGNLVSAIEAVALHPAAAGRTYVVRDGTDLSTPELVRLIGARFEPARGRMFACPPALLRAAGRVIGRPETMASLLGSLCLDDALIRRELGWAPPFKPEQGLVEEIDWYRAGRPDCAA